MNDDELWGAIDAQRLRTAGWLETLRPDDWTHRSLCDGWTVRDVAGHLTLQQMGLGDVLRLALKHPGVHSLNWMIMTSAREKAALPTEQLIGEIRAMVGSRRHNLGVTGYETLLDIVVHGQDMAVPLGRSLPVPPEVAVTAATRAWGYQASRSGRRKSKVFQPLPYAGLRLVATDLDWSVGDGPELRGPVLSLLLLLTGRRVVLPQLEGPGAQSLQQTLQRA
ncbi:maleylpyruvate isomerase family mycothiol-dependent enzyme [Kribbella sp. HUAS MG21]|uniref:Maleylpyruvate isomerase family mycothiol-dependent enzyme n=1 Tax=Kribbella sp. HUAS MG21 TaxID=3160966 RepID=A0AAU7TBA6_9ACTN